MDLPIMVLQDSSIKCWGTWSELPECMEVLLNYEKKIEKIFHNWRLTMGIPSSSRSSLAPDFRIIEDHRPLRFEPHPWLFSKPTPTLHKTAKGISNFPSSERKASWSSTNYQVRSLSYVPKKKDHAFSKSNEEHQFEWHFFIIVFRIVPFVLKKIKDHGQ